jgi:hypothetical protein
MESEPKSLGGKSSSFIREGTSNVNSQSDVQSSSAEISMSFEPGSNVISASELSRENRL